MEQLAQKLKDGNIQVIEVSLPAFAPGNVLVQNIFSLVSAGTEGSTVKAARSSLIEKAKKRPQQVKQVVDTLKCQGAVQTYRAVMKKLDAYSPLGYSCVGRVIKAASSKLKAQSFKKGDLVACGGLTACHSEFISAPENLCVKLQPDADLRQAAYNTLGAIAMQGVRQADLRLGETCAVIGLGLLGQLSCLLLKASGVKAIGIDIDENMVAIAAEHCSDISLTRNTAGIEQRINDFAGGYGCDAVIITAGTSSLDPINFAGAIARKKGTVVVVGAVPTGFDREPHYYKKELQVKMSCSYGPGRYDPVYEEKGMDYPYAYVRWTEKRNMQAFQELICSKKIDVGFLTTHTFKLEDAPKAYDMILNKTEPYLGILIEYDANKKIDNKPILIKNKLATDPHRPSQTKTKALKPHHSLPASQPPILISIGFIGAGSYAQSHLLPNIPKNGYVNLKGVMTSSGTSSRSVAERFGFEFCTGDENGIIENPEINTVFITTRHDSHADYVFKALKAGKHVFVEKPLCLSLQQLDEIVLATDSHGQTQTLKNHIDNMPYAVGFPNVSTNQPILMVGYNRRFSPFATTVKEKLSLGPMAMTYRVNAGAIPKESWIQDTDLGGGRILGEVCHFVDFLTFLSGSLPVSVYADSMNDPEGLNDTLTVSLKYENGSIGTISYFANGDKSLPKERVEVYAHGITAVIEDFKVLTIHCGGKKKAKNHLSQDKGQKNEVRAFLKAVKSGEVPPIPYDQLFSTSLVTFKTLESIHTGQPQKL
jgi:polar amino acid transport system substrate-binding protein